MDALSSGDHHERSLSYGLVVEGGVDLKGEIFGHFGFLRRLRYSKAYYVLGWFGFDFMNK